MKDNFILPPSSFILSIVVYYLHGDHLGSTSLTTDANGNKVSESRYLPYGQTRWGNTGPTDFGFTSQRQEMGFGLYDYNARYYSPVLGRFISPDTIIPDPTNPQSLNRYSYVLNNPVKYTDPSGHSWEPRCLICDIKIDVSDWPDWAKKVGGFVASATVGGHYDPGQEAITGPTEKEWVESAIIDLGTPAPMATVSQGAGRGLKSLVESVLDKAGISNLPPKTGRFARAIPELVAEQIESGNLDVTLSHPRNSNAFITAAEDLARYRSQSSVAERLAISEEQNVVISFSYDGPLASPINQKYAKFVPGGLTSGGAREWIIPNEPIKDLPISKIDIRRLND